VECSNYACKGEGLKEFDWLSGSEISIDSSRGCWCSGSERSIESSSGARGESPWAVSASFSNTTSRFLMEIVLLTSSVVLTTFTGICSSYNKIGYVYGSGTGY
jgi:hypothetical protein